MLIKKNVFKSFRTTEGADRLLETLTEALNTHSQKLNGDDTITVSNLLSFPFEDIAATQSKEEQAKKLELLLTTIYKLKTKTNNKQTNSDIIRGIAREVIWQ